MQFTVFFGNLSYKLVKKNIWSILNKKGWDYYLPTSPHHGTHQYFQPKNSQYVVDLLKNVQKSFLHTTGQAGVVQIFFSFWSQEVDGMTFIRLT